MIKCHVCSLEAVAFCHYKYVVVELRIEPVCAYHEKACHEDSIVKYEDGYKEWICQEVLRE